MVTIITAFGIIDTEDGALPEGQKWPSRREIEDCRRWLLANTSKGVQIIRHRSSYEWKHIVERALTRYVSNGSFIQSALDLGYEHKRIYRGPSRRPSANCWFDIRMKSKTRGEI